MIDYDNKTDFKINKKKIEDIKKYIDNNIDNNIELLIIYKKEMKTINKQYRNIDKATDVLSFPNINEINPNINQNQKTN